MKKKRMYTMFASLLNTSKKLLFFRAFLLLCFCGYGQTVAFSSATGSGAENAGTGLPTLLVNGTVVAASTVTLTTGGTANGADYTLASSTINIPAGTHTNFVIALGLTITGDTAVEPNETIILGLSAPTGDASLVAPISTTYTVLDDDIGSVTVVANRPTVNEDGSGQDGRFRIELNPQNNTGGPITVNYTLLGGSATQGAGQDYTISGTAVFTNGDDRQNIDIIAEDDAIAEGDETVVMTLTGVSSALYEIGTPNTDTVTIIDDDLNAISIGDVVLTEGNTSTKAFTFTVSVDGGGNAVNDIDFTYNTANNTATLANNDYVQVSGGSGTILSGNNSTTVTVQVNGDTNIEGTENFFVNLSAPVNATVNDGQGLGTITNDDIAAISIGDVSLTEGNTGTKAFNFTVSVDGGFNAVNDINFTYNTANGSATVASSDYISVTGGSGTISSGTSSTTVTVLVNGDTTVEAAENFFVNLSAPINATISDAQGEGTITNDDTASISIGNVTLTEGNSGTKAFVFTVSVDGGDNATVPINFTYNTVNGTATLLDGDYVQVSGANGTISAGTSSTTIAVQVNGDTDIEDSENFFMNLSAPVNATINDVQGEGTITNDDIAAISIGDVSLTEGNTGTKAFNFTVSIDGGGIAFSDIDFIYNTANNTATLANNDYVQVSGGSGTILSGANSAIITVQVNGDTDIEGLENFFVNLSAPVNATINDGQGLGTITNDDIATISINNPTPVNEGDTGTSTLNFTVSIDASDAANDITVDYLISGGNEDGISSTLTFPAGTSTLSQQVSVTTNGDDAVEADEDISVTLSNPSANATISLTDNIGTSSFTDNDTAILILADKAENEDVVSGNLIFEATLDKQVDGGFTVGYTFIDGTAVGSGTDFTGTPGELTFVGNAGEVQTITVALVNDQILEQTEDFTVQLAAPSNSAVALAGGGAATGNINDDDNCAPAPILDTSVSTSFCDVIEVNLNEYTATPAPSGTVLTWSTVSDPLNEASYLQPIEVANPPNDGSYFGFFLDTNGTPNDFSDDCASGVIEVELILNTSPTLTGFTDGERCGPGIVSLTAQGSGAASLVWYASVDSDTPLFTGENFSTPVISSTTTYYVEALENNCTSERQAVIALVGEASTIGTATNSAACNVATNGPTLIDLDDRLTGASVGVWSVKIDISNSITINSDNEIDFTGRISGDYVFTYTTSDFTAPCTEETVDVTISVSDCNTDDDLDGLVTGQEVVLGTDPNNPDTDGDGIEDGVEVGTDLNNPLDEDNDGIIDALDSNILDTDGDGVNDQQDPANENPCIPDNSSADCPVDMEITKTADTLAALIGDTVTFTITVNNLTDKIVTSAVVGDLLENGFEFVSQTASIGAYDEITGEWGIENLPALGSATLDIVVTVIEGDTYTNTAQLLESTPLDDNASNDVSEQVVIETTVVEGVDLLIEKRAIPNTVLVGDNVVFELKVTNQSVSDAVSNIRISDVLDVNFEFVSSETDSGTYDELSGEWVIPELQLGEEAVLLITVRAQTLGIFDNTAAYISSSPRDGNAANNSETVRVNVIEKTEASPGFLYNQFSPNGNGQNEILRINLEDPQTKLDVDILYSIVIFDRYGSQVFEAQNESSGDVWDGTWEGKEAPKGTYFYIMNYSINGGEEIVDKGWIQLIR